MMRSLISVTVVCWLMPSAPAEAVSINVIESDDNNYAIFLDAEDDSFNAIGVELVPDNEFEFLNSDNGYEGFFPRGPGEPFTFINSWLFPGPVTPCWCFSLLNVAADEHKITFEGGPLGRNIETNDWSASGLFLANVVLPLGGTATYSVKIVSAGETLGILRGQIGIPEPSGMALMGLNVIVLLANGKFSSTKRTLR